MKIATIDIPDAHGAIAVVSNAIYWVAAVLVALVAGYTQSAPVMGLAGLVSYALAQQCAGSIAFHMTPDSELWAQVADAVSIQWVLAAMWGLGVYALLQSLSWGIALLVLAAWVLWWREANHVRRNVAVGLQILVILGLMVPTVGWGWAGLCLALIVAAVAIQLNSGTHSVWHAAWHILAGIAQALTSSLLALHAGGVTVPPLL